MLRIQRLAANSTALIPLFLCNFPAPVFSGPVPLSTENNQRCSPSLTEIEQFARVNQLSRTDPLGQTDLVRLPDTAAPAYLEMRNLYTGSLLELIQSCDQAAIPALRQAITVQTGSPTPTLAMTVLSEIGGTEVIQLLTEKLRSDPQRSTRQLAARLLGKMPAPAVTNILVAALQTEGNASVRLSIVSALGAVGSLTVANPLRQAALTDVDPRVRLSALLVLNTIPGSGASDLYLPVLQSEPYSEARSTAARVLGRISSLRARRNYWGLFYSDKALSELLQRQASTYALITNPGFEAKVRAALIQVLQTGSDLLTRKEAAEGLGNLGGGTARDALIAALQSDTQILVRKTAADALASIGDDAAREALVTAMGKDRAEEVRLAALRALGNMHSSKTRTALMVVLPATRDPAMRVKIAAMLQSSYGDVPQARDLLLATLQSDQQTPSVQARVAAALNKSNDPVVIQALVNRLAIDTPERARTVEERRRNPPVNRSDVIMTFSLVELQSEVRAAAAKTLGEIGNPGDNLGALNALMDALKNDPEPDVRNAAATALGKLKHPQARRALLASLNSEREAVVLNSIVRALPQKDRAVAVPILISLLQSAPNIRQHTADLLADMRATAAVPALSTILRSGNTIYVQNSAANALGKIGDADSIQALVTVLNSNLAATTRAFAANVLGKTADPAVINPLMRVMVNARESRWLRTQAAYALSAIGKPAMIPLRASLSAPNLETRYLAFTALAEMDGELARRMLSGEQATVTQILTAVNRKNLHLPFMKVIRERSELSAPAPLSCNLDWLASHWQRCRQSPNARTAYFPQPASLGLEN